MARITNMIPPCDYNVEGIDEIRVLDFDDFKGYKFDGDDLYSNCKVIAIMRLTDFTNIPAPDSAKYGSTLSANIYSHVLETFVPALTSDVLANSHLGSKRRYVVLFKAKAGRYYTFGYEAGAVFTYTTQTPESLGATITLTAASIYPLFEADASVLEMPAVPAQFLPDFINDAYCENT